MRLSSESFIGGGLSASLCAFSRQLQPRIPRTTDPDLFAPARANDHPDPRPLLASRHANGRGNPHPGPEPVILTLRPPIRGFLAAERVRIEPVGKTLSRVRLRFGFMETPNVAKALAIARKLGSQFNIKSTSFSGRSLAKLDGQELLNSLRHKRPANGSTPPMFTTDQPAFPLPLVRWQGNWSPRSL